MSNIDTVAPWRLPRIAVPSRYRIEITPDLDDATFEGRVEIDLDVLESTDRIVLNAIELHIRDVVLTTGGQSRSGTVTFDEVNERATFIFDGPVPLGPSVLSCRFTGILNDRLHGFYRSTYVDEAGKKHTIATTQFESTDARRSFPCFDEPDFKAVYEITLIVPNHLEAISNSPVAQVTELDGSRRRTRFAPTMKMSTYLVAYVVGAFEYSRVVNGAGVPIRVITPPGKIHLGDFALEVAKHSLEFFSNYFDIPYPAEKLDLLAIPDFAFGAMENVGCVTFRETALLIDPAHASRPELERVIEVVAHEIAHMWFGNLVTMKWWEGIWLNEAFATFMSYVCMDAFRPDWHQWETLIAGSRELAMAVDSLHSTRAIEYPVGSPDEASGMFDVLTYEKGCCVLRMIEQFLGEGLFRDGVRRYLKSHLYGNTETSDLFDAIEAVSGQPVTAIMNDWIKQGGHPILAIDADGHISQRPFSFGPAGAGVTSAIGGHWKTPVMARSVSGGDTTTLLLDQPGARVDLDIPLVNAGGWGFYRVNYQADQLKSLGERWSELSLLERSNLVSDAWALTLSGDFELAELLALGHQLGADDDPTAWSPIIGAFTLIGRVLNGAHGEHFNTAARSIFGPIAARLGFDPGRDDGERTPMVRAQMIRAMGVFGADETVRTEALARFDSTQEAATELPADTAQAILDVVAAVNRPGDFERFLAAHDRPKTPQEELRFAYGLAGFPDQALAQRTFELALDHLRTQNAPMVVQTLMMNGTVAPGVWANLKEHWSVMADKYPPNLVSRLYGGIVGLSGHPELLDDVNSFIAANPPAIGAKTVTQFQERLAVHIAFGQRVSPTLAEVLTQSIR